MTRIKTVHFTAADVYVGVKCEKMIDEERATREVIINLLLSLLFENFFCLNSDLKKKWKNYVPHQFKILFLKVGI